MTKPIRGQCNACGRKQVLVQKELVTEHPDAYMDRTFGTPEYKEDYSNREYQSICRPCFVIPEEEFEWDEDGEYADLNLRDKIWKSGDWSIIR